MLSIGDKYLDYTIAAYLGRGGMGTVLLCEKPDGERAALKILHPHLLEDEEIVRRFYLEAEVARKIECERVCRVYDIRQVSLGDATSHGILMEYIDGESLADLMEDGEAFSEEWALHVADGVLEALEAIHGAGLLHRDLKPENIVITPDDNIKILDLGLAKVLESSIKLSKTGYFIGTYPYASPEQLTGDPLDFGCDVYSLGVVLYELTTGSRPHKSGDIRELIRERLTVPVRPPSRLNPTLSPFFDMLICDMLEIKPARRLQTAGNCREIIRLREKSDWYRAKISISISRESLVMSTSLRRLARVPRRTGLYGRTEELGNLREWAFESLGFSDGDAETPPHGLAAFVSGEAGIGKTRLVEEMVAEIQAAERPHVALLGRSLSERRHVPYAPLIEMVRDFFMLDDEPEVDLVELFSEYLPNLRPLIPPFLELVTRRRFIDDSDIRGVLNEANLQHLFQTLFITIAKEIPLILFFDDLQWADVNTLEVLSYLISGPVDAPLLIVGTCRDEELETAGGESHPLRELLSRLAGKPHVKRLTLGRLDRRACRDIVDEYFPGADFADALADRLHEKSEGNPFFLTGILNLLFDEGRVAFTDGRWRLEGAIDEIQIPPSLREIIALRLAKLTEQEHETLEAASILGYAFKSQLLGDLTGLPRVRLLRLLQKLEKDRRLIVAVETGYRFDHNIVYEVVYGGILPELRVEYHRLAADILRKSDDIHSVIYDLVHHLRLAGEDRLALEYLPKACERARGEYSNRLALEHAAWGWEAYERLGKPEEFRPLVADLMAERAEVAGILGERSIEVESANRVLDLAGELDDAARLSLAYRLLGEHARHISDFDRALEFYQKAYGKCLEEVGPRCAAILREMGSVRYLKGEDKEAIELYRQALDALAQYPTGPEHAKTHNNLGISLKRIGRIDEAVAEFETALAQAVELGDLHAETFPLGSLALIHYDAGRWEQAHELFLKLLNILEQTGDMVSRARTLLNLGNIFYQVGLYEQAEAYFEESLVARRRMEHRAGEALALHHLAHIDCERDDFDSALERLTEALTIYEEIGDKRGESGVLAALARAHNHAGRHKVALQCADLALEIGKKGGFENRLAEARIENLLARLGSGAEKSAIAEEVKALAEGASFAMFVSQGPRALRRLMQLQDACGLEEESRRTRAAAKETVEKHLAQLNDPEWRAGYRLLYKDLLQPS